MFRLGFAAVFMVALTASASADWNYTKGEQSEFDDDGPMQASLNVKGQFALGVRCDGKISEVIYVTPEKLDNASAALRVFNAAGDPKLKIKIDGGKVLEMGATLSEAGQLETVVATSDAEGSLFAAIRDAKTKVAVMLSLNGKSMYETVFNARGASSNVGKLIKNCKLGD